MGKSILTQGMVTPSFSYDECKCSCCDRLKITELFYDHMKMLEQLRQKVGFSIIINSGYRCPEHNKEILGSPHSWHMKFATDVRPAWENNVDDKEYLIRLGLIRESAFIMEFGGIGTYDTFIHLDMRENQTRWKG